MTRGAGERWGVREGWWHRVPGQRVGSAGKGVRWGREEEENLCPLTLGIEGGN